MLLPLPIQPLAGVPMNLFARLHPPLAGRRRRRAALALAPPLARRRPSGTCPPPIRRPTSTPRTCTQFADDVDKATGGKLKITVHPNASLFKAPEIKRAVQGGQAQIGEILLVNFENEWHAVRRRRHAVPRRPATPTR